jgi:hypothetical protein
MSDETKAIEETAKAAQEIAKAGSKAGRSRMAEPSRALGGGGN